MLDRVNWPKLTCHNPAPRNVMKHQLRLSLFPTAASQTGSPSQNVKQPQANMTILLCIVSKDYWDPLGVNSTVVSCPYSPGQQCALPTQGGVGRAALGLHPGA